MESVNRISLYSIPFVVPKDCPADLKVRSFRLNEQPSIRAGLDPCPPDAVFAFSSSVSRLGKETHLQKRSLTQDVPGSLPAF
jgi:hypothetical protein